MSQWRRRILRTKHPRMDQFRSLSGPSFIAMFRCLWNGLSHETIAYTMGGLNSVPRSETGSRVEIAQDIQSCPERFLIRHVPVFQVIHALLIGAISRWRRSPPIPQAQQERYPRLKAEECGLDNFGRAGRGQAGETVTFKVTAKLGPRAYIYKYSKESQRGSRQHDLRLLRYRRV